MAYASWSVVAGEQPSAAKWNILGTNDAHFYTYTGEGTNAIQQSVYNQVSAVATGTTLIPADDTIPQITEGTEFMTQAITPKSATNILEIKVILMHAYSVASYTAVALFQDATANALAVDVSHIGSANLIQTTPLIYRMVAGTTSSTTFRVRAGGHTAGTLTINGNASARLYGAIPKSGIYITEYKV